MEPTTLPVLPRLDRLDRLVELLEEKHGKSRMFESPIMRNDDNDVDEHKQKIVDNSNCKTLSSALNDVHYKGNLIDRLAVLENRVLQLSLDMEEGNTSRSSSSTAYATSTKEEKEFPVDKCSTKSKSKGKRRGHFKWMGWFAMRC